jgi:hypothetical protein
MVASGEAGNFEVTATAPAAAVSVSAWIFHGEAGFLTVDDLSLSSTPAEGSSPTAAGAQTATHVRLANGLTGDDLAVRDPGRYTDPRDEATQPDLTIQGPRGPVLGENIYEANAARQKIIVPTGRRKLRAIFPDRLAERRRRAARCRDSQRDPEQPSRRPHLSRHRSRRRQCHRRDPHRTPRNARRPARRRCPLSGLPEVETRDPPPALRRHPSGALSFCARGAGHGADAGAVKLRLMACEIDAGPTVWSVSGRLRY